MAEKTILVFADGSVSEAEVTVARGTKVVWLPDLGPNDITIAFNSVDEVPFTKGPGGWPDNKASDKGKKVDGTIKDLVNGHTVSYVVTGFGQMAPEALLTNPKLIVQGGIAPPPASPPPKRRKAAKKARKAAKKSTMRKGAKKRSAKKR